MKRVKTTTVGFGDTVAATFTVIGRRIMDSPVGDALRWLGDAFSKTADFIGKAMFNGIADSITRSSDSPQARAACAPWATSIPSPSRPRISPSGPAAICPDTNRRSPDCT